MKIEKLQDILTGKGGKELLTVESDGLSIQAAVIDKNDKDEVFIKAYAKSSELELPAALKEIIAQISNSSAKPLASVVLLDYRVYTTILELPVDPAKPLTFKEMQELIRWELEPYMSQSRVRRLGAILAGRGYIKPADVERVIAVMEGKKKEAPVASGKKKMLRFGETALTMGLISHEQLEESLMLQQSFQQEEGETVCGWAPLAGKPAAGKWRWLVSGVNVSFREHAVKSFKDAGLTLQAVYPIVGTAAASLNSRAVGINAVLEFQSGFLSYVRLSKGEVIDSRIHFSHEQDNLIRSCIEFVEDDVENIWLAGQWPDIKEAADKIASGVGKSCNELSVEAEVSLPQGSNSCAFAGMAGAFRHFLKLSPRQNAVYIPAHIPLAPLTQHKYFRYGVMAALTVALCIMIGVVYQLKRYSLKELAQAAGETGKAQAEVDRLKTELVSLSIRRDFLSDELPRREALIPELFNILQSAMPDDIIMNSFYEDEAGVMHIEGWALSVRSIQIFKLELSEKLPRMRLDSKDYPIQEKQDWMGLPGYSFKFDLITGDAPAGSAAQAPLRRH